MPPQRACDAESQVGNKLLNGPLRAWMNCLWQSILRRGASVIAKDMSVSDKGHRFSMNARWHRG
ncbi:MAG: hypothetical protein E7639_00555 [Ruminococcaceae bacterium]|nr:hypothetical protein [Oscillospiraceae bacterium]